MAQKQHLHELLKEDQEPFLLNNYISNKRKQLKRPSTPSKTTLQLRKKQNSNFPNINLCNNPCFTSFQSTPHNNLTKSPLFDLTSPPNKTNSNPIFLHIPTKTASLLLDAALRIHKHSKTKPHNSLFGSFFKRITNRTRSSRKSEENEEKVSVKDILKWESSGVRRRDRSKREEEEESKGFCNGRTSSAVWSESNEEDISFDMETSSSSSHSCEEEEALDNEKEKVDCACFEDHGFFCESPFRFVLQTSPSSASGHRTPDFSSPAASPNRHRTEDKENNGGGEDVANKFQSREEEEDKEQNSPVSVLDPPFDDVHENDDEEGGFDLECSYANVQRTKQQLLDRLHRFEQLAELDPVELDRMLDQEDNEYETFSEEGDKNESETSCEENALRELVFEVMCHSSVRDKRQDPEDLKRLIYDLMKEEHREVEISGDRNKVMMRRVCRKMELWNEVESNTIDMMIEEDLSREESGRKKNEEETRELASELELHIFCFLLEEFSEDLLEC